MRHLLRLDDLSLREIDQILDRSIADGIGRSQAPVTLGTLFTTSSLRTRVGFEAAAHALGHQVISVTERRSDSQMSNGESLSDTLRTLSGSVGCVVARVDGSVPELVAEADPICPVVCAGDQSHHPTQTLVDLAAIRRFSGSSESDLRIGLLGDLAMRSATSLLGYFARRAPAELRLIEAPGRWATDASTSGIDETILTRRGPLDLAGLDVLYVVGLPPRSGGQYLDDNDRKPFTVDRPHLNVLPPTAIILSPLPVVDEFGDDARLDPRLKAFEQSDHGVAVRAATLDHLLS